jgi:hypothetical protein
MGNTRRRWFGAALAVGTVLGVLVIPGCGVSQPSRNRVSLTNGDSGRAVSVAVGDGIDITLQTVGPGQYSTNPTVSSGVLRFVSVSDVRPPNPGGPRQLFRFDTVGQGRATISIPHTVQPTAFELTVDVR